MFPTTHPQARGIGLHVDNCLGGFLLSYMSKQGLYTEPWDFSVPQVTSMSVDVHKYGFASKGASVVGFRDPALRRLSYVPSWDGCEGLYVTTTLQGSRSAQASQTSAVFALLLERGRVDEWSEGRARWRLTARGERGLEREGSR